MSSICVSAIKGTVMRTIKLDTCGNPVTGAASSVVVEQGFISIKPSPQYEDGTEFTQKLANGLLCVNQKDAGQLKRVALDILMCVLDPDQIVQLTGARLNTSGGVTGTGAFFNEQVINAHTSLEVWQLVSGRNACSVNGLQQYVYWAFPNVTNVQVKDWTVENATLNFGMSGETQGAGPLWAALPTVLPPSGYLGGSAFVAGDHYGYNVTTVAPPAAGCGAVLLA
jgi:hypothetical protein